MRRIVAICLALALTLSMTAAAAASPMFEAPDVPAEGSAVPWMSTADAFLEAICTWDAQRIVGMTPQTYLDAAAEQEGADVPTFAADLASVWQVICGRLPVRGTLSDAAERAPDSFTCVSAAPQACWSFTLTLTMASGGVLALPIYALCYDGAWYMVYDAWRDGAVRDALALSGEPTEPVAAQDYYLMEMRTNGFNGAYDREIYEYDANMYLVRYYSDYRGDHSLDVPTDFAIAYTNDLRGNAILEQSAGSLDTLGAADNYLTVHCYDQAGRRTEDIMCYYYLMTYQGIDYTSYSYNEAGQLQSTHKECGVNLNLWDHTLTGTPYLVQDVYYTYDETGTLLYTETYTANSGNTQYNYDEYDEHGNRRYGYMNGGSVEYYMTNTYDEYGNRVHSVGEVPEYYSRDEADYIYLSAAELRTLVGAPEPTPAPAATEEPAPADAPAPDMIQLPAVDLAQGMSPADIQAMPWGAAMNAYLTALCTWNADQAAMLAPEPYLEQAGAQAGLDVMGLRSELSGVYAVLGSYYPVRGTLTDAAEQPAEYFTCVSRPPQACWSMTLTLTLACGQTFPMPLYALCYDGVWSIAYDAWREMSVDDALASLDPAREGGPGAPLLAQTHYEDIDGYVEDTAYNYSALEQRPRVVTYERRYDNDPTETVYGECYLSGSYQVLMETHTDTWAMLPQTVVHCYDAQGRLIEDIMNYDAAISYQDVNYCRYEYDELGQLVTATDYGQVTQLDLWTHEVTLPETYYGTSVVSYTYDGNGLLLTTTEQYGEQTTSIKDYDEHGNAVQEREWLWFFGESDEPSVSTFANTYDEQGNLLSVQEYANGVNISTATRVYQAPAEPPAEPVPPAEESVAGQDSLELIRAYWQQNIGRDCPAVLGDFDRDGSTDLVYVDDPEGDFINGYLLTVRNGAVEQINVLQGGSSHMVGWFNLFARVDENGTGTLIRYVASMFQGVGSVGFISYYIDGSERVDFDSDIYTNDQFIEDFDAFSAVFDGAMADIAQFIDGATCLCTIGCDCINYANYTMAPTAYQILGL